MTFSQKRILGALTVGGKVAQSDIRCHERRQLAPTGPIVTSFADFRNFSPDAQPPDFFVFAFRASQALKEIPGNRKIRRPTVGG